MHLNPLIKKIDSATIIGLDIGSKFPFECRYPHPPSVAWVWDIRDAVDHELDQCVGRDES